MRGWLNNHRFIDKPVLMKPILFFIALLCSIDSYSQVILEYMNFKKDFLIKIGEGKSDFKQTTNADEITLQWFDTTYNCKIQIRIDIATDEPSSMNYTPIDIPSMNKFIKLLNTKFSIVSDNYWEDAMNVKLNGMHGYYTCISKVFDSRSKTESSFLFSKCRV